MYKLIREMEQAPIDVSKPVFCDVETYTDEGKSDGALFGAIRLVQVFQEGWYEAYLYDCMFVELGDVLSMLENCTLVFHNATYDLGCINLYTEWFWYPKFVHDTFYLCKLFFTMRNKFGFYDCLDYAGYNDDNIQSINKKENQKADWGGPLSDVMLTYAAYDVVYLEKLFNFVKEAQDHKCYELDIKNLEYAVEYSRRGIPINKERVKEMLLEATEKSEYWLRELPINPASPKQCQEYLGESTTDERRLTELKLDGNTMAESILEARHWLKKRSRLKKFYRDKINGFYNPCYAISGRFSCTGGNRFGYDNLQNVPREFLKCFEAPEGWVFVYMDYAGLELRMGVCWVGESVMRHLILEGKDMHTYTAARVFNVEEKDVSKVMRLVGKVLNFQMIYGASAGGIMGTLMSWGGLKLPFQEVASFRNEWLKTYPAFAEWINMNKKLFNVQKYLDVSTALGRKVRVFKFNEGLNIPIQGSSSEVTKTSLVLLKERYPNENLVSTIHDSNTLLVPEDEAEDWVFALNECMIDAWYHVIDGLVYPTLPMPKEAQYNKVWDF